MKYCRRCGAQLQDNAVTCYSCRTKQTTDTAAAASAYYTNQNQQYQNDQYYNDNQQYEQEPQYDHEQQYTQDDQYRQEEYVQPMQSEQPPKTPGWLIALIAGLGALAVILVILIIVMVSSDKKKDKDELLEIATEQYSITSEVTTETTITATTSEPETLPAAVPETTTAAVTTTVKSTTSTTKRSVVIQTANTRRETTTTTTAATTTAATTTTTTAAATETTTQPTITEPPLQDVYIELSGGSVLSAKASLMGRSRDELMNLLETQIPETEEYMEYGTDLEAADVKYNGISLKLVFQSDKLVMIVYDVMKPLDQETLEKTCEELGLDPESFSIEDGIEASDPDGNTYQMFGCENEETGDKFYRQRYVYSGIK